MHLYENEHEQGKPRILVSHLTLRTAVGMLGILLPVVVWAWGTLLGGAPWQDSISDYYATDARDWFVGTLFVLAFFLMAYRGIDPRDDQFGDLGWVCALGVALCPNSSPHAWVAGVHFFSAVVLFLVFARFAYFIFPKDDPPGSGRGKFSKGCGIAIVVFLGMIGVYLLALRGTAIDRFRPIFVLEWAALWAFGLSWFVQGHDIRETWLLSRVFRRDRDEAAIPVVNRA